MESCKEKDLFEIEILYYINIINITYIFLVSLLINVMLPC